MSELSGTNPKVAALTKQTEHNEQAWSLPGVLGFFDSARATTAQVYRSEWIFLRELLREGMSVLDVGCAQGGFAAVLAEHLSDFRYTGVDVSAAMVERARFRHPDHRFLQVPEADLSALDGETFDLVLVLGILHLHEKWRDTLAAAWTKTAGALVLDLREHEAASIEDKTVSSFRMDFGVADADHAAVTLPYIILNSADALATLRHMTPDRTRLSHFGYLTPVSGSASAPVDQVMANVWCVER